MPRKIVKSGLVGLLSLAGCVTNPYSPYQYANDFNNKQQIKQQTQQPQNMFFACNSWGDSDGDGHIKVPEEITGIKNNFFTNEQIRFALSINDFIRGSTVFELYDDSGILINQGYEMQIPRDSFDSFDSNIRFGYYPPRWLAPGGYTGKWRLNKRYVGETKINVFDKKEQKESMFSSTQQFNQDQNKFYLFAVNRWNDLNGNGLVDYPYEIGKEKYQFSTDEHITLMCRIFNQVGSTLEFALYEFRTYDKTNRDKRKIKEIDACYYGKIQSNDCFASYSYEPGKLKAGLYKTIWFVNGKGLGDSTTISVIDNKP